MNVIKKGNIRGKEFVIAYEEGAKHPLDMTDAPVHVGSWASMYSICQRGKNEGYPGYEPGMATVWINLDNKSATECKLCDANAAVWLYRKEFAEYAGGEWDRRKLLQAARGHAEEIIAWANGNCYGYVLGKTFVRDGRTYVTGEVINSCWGYYGKSGLLAIADCAPASLRAEVRKWARRQ
jgi:hypothetical protein